VFNFLGVISILTAYAAIYYSKEENSKEHLTSWHGLIGKENNKAFLMTKPNNNLDNFKVL